MYLLEFLYNFFGRAKASRGVLRESVLKICSIFTREHPCRSVISVKLLCNFIEITLRHGCSPVNLLHIFRTPFCKNIYGVLFLFGVSMLKLLQVINITLITPLVLRLGHISKAKNTNTSNTTVKEWEIKRSKMVRAI